MMPATFCTNCGVRLPPLSTRCPSCGAIARSDDVALPTQAVPIVADADASPRVPHHDPEGMPAILEVLRGRIAGARFAVGARTTLGRSPGSDILLDDVSVSRDHATIVMVAPERFIVTDSGSLNGTYLNGERIEQATLYHGDMLQIGMFKMAFATGSAG